MIIMTYVHNRTYFLPRCISDDEFAYISYSIWAATELLIRLQDSPRTDPTIVIDDFIMEMTMFSNYGEDGSRNVIFATAADAGKEILALIERRV